MKHSIFIFHSDSFLSARRSVRKLSEGLATEDCLDSTDVENERRRKPTNRYILDDDAGKIILIKSVIVIVLSSMGEQRSLLSGKGGL